jgi:hypothetical protein
MVEEQKEQIQKYEDIFTTLKDLSEKIMNLGENSNPEPADIEYSQMEEQNTNMTPNVTQEISTNETPDPTNDPTQHLNDITSKFGATSLQENEQQSIGVSV